MKGLGRCFPSGGAGRALGLLALLSSTMLSSVPAGAADTSAMSKKIEMLQQQLQMLQQQLNDMKASEQATKDAVASEQAARKAKDADEEKYVLDHGGHV